MEYLIRLRSFGARALVALAVMLVCLSVSILLHLAQFLSSLFVFEAGVVIIALICGFGLSLAAIALSVLFQSYFFQYPLYSIKVDSAHDAVELVVFLSVALSVSWAGSRLRAAFAREEIERERAESATRARDALLAVVSHDLKNPLAAIRMSAELLRRTGAETGRMGELIVRSCDQMFRIIQDLLDLDKMARGHLELERTELAVSALLGEVRLSIEPLARAKRQTLEIADPGPKLRLEVDRARLLRVFSNLIGNAIKFTPAGGRIDVAAVEDGDRIRFSVRDTGPGIPTQDQRHVFDRYWQAPATSRLGSGLGLSTSAAVVGAHGGRLWVESEPGRGSCFQFTLPRGRQNGRPGLTTAPLPDIRGSRSQQAE